MRNSPHDGRVRGQVMKRVFVVGFSTILMSVFVGLPPAQAARHSGPEALAKGSGEASSTATQNQPIMRQICERATNICFGEFPVARTVTVTETEESFVFSARLGPKTSTLDPTSGAFGSMNWSTSPP